MKITKLSGVAICAIGGQLLAAPIYNPANGHYYEAAFSSAALDWPTAKSLAEASSYLGLGGHLATITSADENGWLVANLGGAVDASAFLGGFQPPGSLEPSGGWQWVTGEAWLYTNWLPGQPSNTRPDGEDVLHFYGAGDPGKWNDIHGLRSLQRAFIVEYESSSVPDAGGCLGLLSVAFVALGLHKPRPNLTPGPWGGCA